MSTTTTSTSKDYLNEIYDAQLKSAKEQLTQAYNESASSLDAETEKLQKQQHKDLVATNVEAQRAQRDYAEIQNAYGLSSGAMAQARLAQDNQLQNDMTDIRTAAAAADADVERRRSLLAQQYASAIQEAQANNDLARAQALYELAREEEARLLAQQQAATVPSAPANSSTGGNADNSAPPVTQEVVKPNSSNVPSVNNGVSGIVGSALGDDRKKPNDNSGTGSSASSGGTDDHVNLMPEKGGSNTKPTPHAKDMAAGNSSNSTAQQPAQPADTNLTVDTASINALGYGPIGEAELNRLIAAGEVEEYIEGNMIKFRKTAKAQSTTPSPTTRQLTDAFMQAAHG